jgi:hypothetical protein
MSKLSDFFSVKEVMTSDLISLGGFCGPGPVRTFASLIEDFEAAGSPENAQVLRDVASEMCLSDHDMQHKEFMFTPEGFELGQVINDIRDALDDGELKDR